MATAMFVNIDRVSPSEVKSACGEPGSEDLDRGDILRTEARPRGSEVGLCALEDRRCVPRQRSEGASARDRIDRSLLTSWTTWLSVVSTSA